MMEISLSRDYLESLADSELLEIAGDLVLDMPENPRRDFVIRELLETAAQDEDKSAFFPEPEMAVTDAAVIDASPLPRRYNIAFIEVMVRDPLWAFAFWEIKASDKEQFEKSPGFTGYYLKVSPFEKSGEGSQKEHDGVFTVPVKSGDTARYLGLAPVADEGNSQAGAAQYKVEFCAGLGETETVLAVSNPIQLPRQPVFSFSAGTRNPGGVFGNQLAGLSGFGDFHITQRNERPPRKKRSG